MAEITPSKETVKLIKNNPVAYMLGVAILLLGIFVYRSFNANDNQNADCKEAVQFERARADAAQKQLLQVLLDDKDKKEADNVHRDSVLRATVGNKAKSIINNHK